MTRNDFYR